MENNDSNALLFTNWFTSKDIPGKDPEEEDLTDYVLIDLDGWRKDFGIGYVNLSDNTWYLTGRDERTIDLKHMRWTNLPLASRDKK